MRIGEEVVLECPVGTLKDVYPHLMEKAEDKSVLNVGAAGNASVYLPDRPHLWLHTRLIDTAAEVIGLDIDPVEIGNAAEHGVVIEQGNCEDAQLGRKFDMIVMLEVIEHVDNLATAIHNLLDHLTPGGELVMTTPNATHIGNIIDAFRRRPANVFYQHVNLFTPEHFQAFCDRHDLNLMEAQYFTFDANGGLGMRIKTAIIRMFGRLSPRLHSTFLVSIRKRGEPL